MSISKTCLGKISSYFNTNFQIMEDVKCSLFHKTLPKSSLPMHWISVRFYEMGDISDMYTVYLLQLNVPVVKFYIEIRKNKEGCSKKCFLYSKLD